MASQKPQKTLRKVAFKTTDAHAHRRLDQVLAEVLPESLGQHLSKAKVRKLIVAGAVYLNGKRVRIASKELLREARIEVYVDLAKLMADETRQDRPFEMDASRVLFEDEDLIVVNKPAGLPTQATLDDARDHLFAAVKRFLVKRDGKADPYLGLHHRLDRDTSGALLLTKSHRVNAGVARLFSEHLAVKTYQALAYRSPSGGAMDFPLSTGATWTVKNYLRRRDGVGKKSIFASVRSGGDFAHTDFRILERPGSQSGSVFWIEAKPKTGRTHQIRVHLSEGGFPILGDATYGGRSEVMSAQGSIRIPRLMLHAVRLEFPHPITGQSMAIDCPLAPDFLQCLEKLRS